MRIDNSPHGTRLMFRWEDGILRDESRAQCGHDVDIDWPIVEQRVLR